MTSKSVAEPQNHYATLKYSQENVFTGEVEEFIEMSLNLESLLSLLQNRKKRPGTFQELNKVITALILKVFQNQKNTVSLEVIMRDDQGGLIHHYLHVPNDFILAPLKGRVPEFARVNRVAVIALFNPYPETITKDIAYIIPNLRKGANIFNLNSQKIISQKIPFLRENGEAKKEAFETLAQEGNAISGVVFRTIMQTLNHFEMHELKEKLRTNYDNLCRSIAQNLLEYIRQVSSQSASNRLPTEHSTNSVLFFFQMIKGSQQNFMSDVLRAVQKLENFTEADREKFGRTLDDNFKFYHEE